MKFPHISCRCSSSRSARALWRMTVAACVASLSLIAVIAQVEAVAQELVAGQVIEREMAGGQKHAYRIRLESNQYLHAIVEQMGVDVVVSVFKPDGAQALQQDTPNGSNGPESISLIADAAGEYRLELRTLSANAPAGKYRVRLEALRAPQPVDRARMEAERVANEANRLAQQPTPEARREAVSKFTEAAKLWRQLNEPYGEALALRWLGALYGSNGEFQNALDSFQQSAARFRSAGDTRSLAEALNYVGNAYTWLRRNEDARVAYEQAFAVAREAGDRGAQAAALYNLAGLRSAAGEFGKAIELLNQALPLVRASKDRASEAVMLLTLAGNNVALRNKEQAVRFYTELLELHRKAADRASEAQTLAYLGAAYQQLNEPKLALDAYRQAAELFRTLGQPQAAAYALQSAGVVHASLGDWTKALEAARAARQLLQAANDRAGEAMALFNIGIALTEAGKRAQDSARVEEGINAWQESVRIRSELGDRASALATLPYIAAAYAAIGQQDKAQSFYEQARDGYRQANDRAGEANMLHSLGHLHDDATGRARAIEYYQQAVALYGEVSDKLNQAKTLDHIGEAELELGHMAQALAAFQSERALQIELKDRAGEAEALNNIGLIQGVTGEHQQGLNSLEQALIIWRELGDQAGEARAFALLGNIYGALNQPSKAIEDFRSALSLFRAAKDEDGQAQALYLISVTYAAQGETGQARDYQAQMQKLLREDSRDIELAKLLGEGILALSADESRKASEIFAQVVKLAREERSSTFEAMGLTFGGMTLSLMGENQQAHDMLMLALPLLRATNLRSLEVVALGGLAQLESNLNRLDAARAHAKEAIDLAESLRANVIQQELRTSFFSSIYDLFKLYVEILMRLHRQQPEAGYAAAAFEAAERGRARSLLETLAEAHADIREGVDPQLLARERELQQQLEAEEAAQSRLLSSAHTAEQAAVAKKEFATLLTKYQETQAQIRARSPRYAALTQPQPLDLAGVQAQLDKDTLLLQYALGDDKSYLWAITPEAMKIYELPGGEEIEKAARRFYELLKARGLHVEDETPEQRQARVARADEQLPEAAQALSRMLLEPVAPLLGQKRLVIVADGAVQYVPFAALPAPEAGNTAQGAANKNETRPPLVVEHEIVNLPSASIIAELRRETAGRPPAPKTLAVLADPVFSASDERVRASAIASKSGTPAAVVAANQTAPPLASPLDAQPLRILEHEEAFNLRIARLPYTRREAENILAMTPQTMSWHAFDFDASRQAITSAELSRYRYLHFATHGYLDTERPEQSALVLSLVDREGRTQSGFLRAHEVYNLRLFADLVVLSACETGLGKEIRGEGLIGLTRGFMYAGAPRLVVSLWSVNDQATAVLMEKFYRRMLKDGQPTAAALRAAQIEMLRTKEWRAPFYWAAFTLQGEWR